MLAPSSSTAEQSLVGGTCGRERRHRDAGRCGARRRASTAPQFSPDGRLVYAHRRDNEGDCRRRRRAGCGRRAIELNAGYGSRRWASAFTLVDGEPMAWIAMSAGRPYGAVTPVGDQRNAWLIAFYPGRGAVSRPFRLPGQSLALGAIHAPSPLSGLR
jgi:hypothetical protein